MNSWHVVQCKSKQDNKAERELINQGFEVFRPRLLVRKRGRWLVESFFPGYIFISLSDVIQSFYTVRSTRGVLRLVKWGETLPAVPEELIQDLRMRTGEEGYIRLELPHLKKGQPVRIVDGPFSGLMGLFKGKSGEERVVILMDFLSRQHNITLPRDYIEEV